ncbi:hypothetical protein [Pseudodonghicola sp.]|uniref:hypothetical protein n=1 Tax=Pseudodonghicola sp. TaxID=1969463 RepID=UPI003A9794CF
MTDDTRLPAGSRQWLTMVGERLQQAAQHADLPSEQTVSLVERYSDGEEIAPGLVQGLRFDILCGVPSFRIGAAPEEKADITVEVTSEAARRLNQLFSTDPAYALALEEYLKSGALRMCGDPAKLGAWFGAVHDDIVRRTDLNVLD